MKLRYTDSSLKEVCETLEEELETNNDLNILDIGVEVNQGLWEKDNTNPACYDSGKEIIIVFREPFNQLTDEQKKVALLHELGHVYCDKINLDYIKDLFEDIDSVSLLKWLPRVQEEVAVDHLVCKWGYEELIVNYRNLYSKYKYGNELRNWKKKSDYLESIAKKLNL